MTTTSKTILAKLISSGNLTPGSVVPTEWISGSTIQRYVNRGWIEKRGMFVLTALGYSEN